MASSSYTSCCFLFILLLVTILSILAIKSSRYCNIRETKVADIECESLQALILKYLQKSLEGKNGVSLSSPDAFQYVNLERSRDPEVMDGSRTIIQLFNALSSLPQLHNLSLRLEAPNPICLMCTSKSRRFRRR